MCRVHCHYFYRTLLRDATQSAILPWQVVCLSLCNVKDLRYCGHIGWNSWKIISRLISLTFSVFQHDESTLKGKPQILAGIGVGYRKLSIFDI